MSGKRARHIRKELEEALSVKSLQPGFVVVNYDPEVIDDPRAFKLRSWEELKARGFYGGACLPKGVDLTSLTDQDLAQVGLQRIPAVTHDANP